MSKVIVLSGPTATGKTQTSLELAKEIDAQIVNFDSLVFYKELLIGTARPTEAQLQEVKHYLVATESISEPLNAAQFVKKATLIINKIHDQSKTPILVGGSGFYLQALMEGMYPSQTTPESIIRKSNDLYESQGIKPFLEILKRVDPSSFQKLHENDHYRIRRAVEHYWNTKTAFSVAKARLENEKRLREAHPQGWVFFHTHLDLPKEEHWPIIKQRTQQMIQRGLIQEVQNLLKQGFSGKEKPLQSIGYKETIEFLIKESLNIEQLIEKIYISTRQLAKAQRTWFKSKISKTIYHPLKDTQKLIKDTQSFIKLN